MIAPKPTKAELQERYRLIAKFQMQVATTEELKRCRELDRKIVQAQSFSFDGVYA